MSNRALIGVLAMAFFTIMLVILQVTVGTRQQRTEIVVPVEDAYRATLEVCLQQCEECLKHLRARKTGDVNESDYSTW